jgi:hypothetical protein
MGGMAIARKRVGRTKSPGMKADTAARLIEEMIDLKLRQQAEVSLATRPELALLLEQKRETDRRRLEHLRIELARSLES